MEEKPVNTTKIVYYLLHNASSLDPTMGLSSAKEHELDKLNVHGSALRDLG
jgi:hypothetical protein